MHFSLRGSAHERRARADIGTVGFSLVALILLNTLLTITLCFGIWSFYRGPSLLGAGWKFSDLPTGLVKLIKYAKSRELPYLISALCVTAVCNSVPFLLCAGKTGIRLDCVFSRSKTGAAETTLYAVAAIGANLVISWMIALISQVISIYGFRLTTPDFSLPKQPPATAAMLILLLIVAPVTEEFIFRGVILRVFARYGSAFAIVGSSLLWALLHGNLVQSIPVFAIGIFLGILALRSGSVWPGIAVHMANNLFSTLLSVLGASASGNFPVRLLLGLFEIGVILAAITFCCIFYRHFEYKKFRSPEINVGALFITSLPVLAVVLYEGYRIITSVHHV